MSQMQLPAQEALPATGNKSINLWLDASSTILFHDGQLDSKLMMVYAKGLLKSTTFWFKSALASLKARPPIL